MTDRICAIPGCAKPHLCRGWCSAHYQQWRMHGDPLHEPPARGLCEVNGCEMPKRKRQWCSNHYAAWRRHGDPTVVIFRQTREKRCLQCGATDYDYPERKFCSANCRRIFTTGWIPAEPRSCSACGSVFVPARNGTRFCSSACIAWNGKHPDGARRVRPSECVQCGETFTAANIRQITCSARCRQSRLNGTRRAHRLHLPVETFANREIFERDEWTCYLCDKPVHRRRSAPGQYDPLLASIDHLIPISDPSCPGHLRWNVATTHLRCNMQKQNFPVAAALALATRLRFQYDSGDLAA